MNKTVFASAALAAVFGLTACGASVPVPAGQPGQGPSVRSSANGDQPAPSPATASASAAELPAAPTATLPASAVPSVATPTATPPATGVTPGAKAPAALTSFTFPDGHLSFSYPANWTVRVEKTAPSASRSPGVDSVRAVVADGTGNELLAITSNAYGGGASGPVLRTVLDNAPVPGLTDTSGEQLAFGFAFDSFAGHPEFHMGIRKSREFAPSPESSGSTLVPLANGLLDTRVLFDIPAFPSIEAAKAWMDSEQYRSLKRLLLSITYR